MLRLGLGNQLWGGLWLRLILRHGRRSIVFKGVLHGRLVEDDRIHVRVVVSLFYFRVKVPVYRTPKRSCEK